MAALLVAAVAGVSGCEPGEGVLDHDLRAAHVDEIDRWKQLQ